MAQPVLRVHPAHLCQKLAHWLEDCEIQKVPVPSSKTRIPDRAEPLERGEFAKVAYCLGRTRATGVLAVYRAGIAGTNKRPDVFVVRRGYLMAPNNPTGRSGDPPSGPPIVLRNGLSQVLLDRQVARRLAEMAGLIGAYYTFDGGLAAYPPGAVSRQFPLAAWARNHIEAQLDAAYAQQMIGELAGVRMSAVLHIAPDPALCDETDLRILDAIRMPRRLDQIWAMARTPRYRLLSFLHFLRTVGGLNMIGIAAPPPQDSIVPGEAHRLLGVPADADQMTVKRAYRRLARTLHPDLHPDASQARRRVLERKLSAVTDAYIELTNSTARS